MPGPALTGTARSPPDCSCRLPVTWLRGPATNRQYTIRVDAYHRLSTFADEVKRLARCVLQRYLYDFGDGG